MLKEQLQKTLSEYKPIFSRKHKVRSINRNYPLINIQIYYSEPYPTNKCSLVLRNLKPRQLY